MSTDKTEQAHPLDKLIRVGTLRPLLVEALREFFGRSDLTGPNGQSFIETCEQIAAAAPPAQQQSEPTRSQKLADAGFTRRDKRLECDECGEKFSAQLLPAHKCAATPPSLQEPQAPVAWRYRYSSKARWNYADGPANDPAVIEEPLYASPRQAVEPQEAGRNAQAERPGRAQLEKP